MKKNFLIIIALSIPFFFTSCETEQATLSSEDFFVAFDQENLNIYKRPIAYDLPHMLPLYVAAERGGNVSITLAKGESTAIEGEHYEFTFDFPTANFPIGAGYLDGGIITTWLDNNLDTLTLSFEILSNTANYKMGFFYGENADSTSHTTLTYTILPGSDVTFNITDVSGNAVDGVTIMFGEYIEQTNDYYFIQIPRGNQSVTISKDNYWTVQRMVNVNAPSISVNHTMELENTATFVVTNEAGGAINDAVISVRSVTPPAPALVVNYAAGEYVVHLPERDFTYRVNRVGFAEAEGSFSLKGGDATVEVTMVAE